MLFVFEKGKKNVHISHDKRYCTVCQMNIVLFFSSSKIVVVYSDLISCWVLQPKWYAQKNFTSINESKGSNFAGRVNQCLVGSVLYSGIM